MKSRLKNCRNFVCSWCKTEPCSQREPTTQSPRRCVCQIKKGMGRRGAVGVHVTDQIRVHREFEALDQRAALANRRLEFQRADDGEFGGDAPDDADGVVGAAVEHDDDLEFAGIMRAKELRVVAQHRFDAALLVISRNEEQQTGIRHEDSVTETGGQSTLGNGRRKFAAGLVG